MTAAVRKSRSGLMGTAIRSSMSGPSRGSHYHASTQNLRAILLQRDNQDHTMFDEGTRGTEIMYDQYMIDSALTNQ